MDILATAERNDHGAADPETLLLLSFEVGREEPRIQRLRDLIRDDDDRALVEAVVGWLGQRRRRARLEARVAPSRRAN
jgi:hypothetical protein